MTIPLLLYSHDSLDNGFDLNQQLPAWAQKSCGIEIEQMITTQSHDDHVTGKWAEVGIIITGASQKSTYYFS